MERMTKALRDKINSGYLRQALLKSSWVFSDEEVDYIVYKVSK
jgi:hypothetical protein